MFNVNIFLFLIFFLCELTFASDFKNYHPGTYLQEKSVEDSKSDANTNFKTEVVSIGEQKYLKIIGESGALYLPFLGDIEKEHLENSSCLKLHKAPQLKETISQDYHHVLEANIRPKVKLYASLIVQTIKDKCTNRTEKFILPSNPTEVGVSVEHGKNTYKINNRINPFDLKSVDKQINPGVSVGTEF